MSREETAEQVASAVKSFIDGNDGEAVTAILRLFNLDQTGLIQHLLTNLVALTPDGAVHTMTLLPADPAGRLPDDQSLHNVIAAIHKGDPERLSTLTDGSPDDLLVLLVGVTARLSGPTQSIT